MSSKKRGFVLTLELMLIFVTLLILVPLIVFWLRVILMEASSRDHHDHAHDHPHGYSQHHHHDHEAAGHDETVSHDPNSKPHHHPFNDPVAAVAAPAAAATESQLLIAPQE